MRLHLKRWLIALSLTIASPALVTAPAQAADLLTGQIKIMLGMISDVFRTADPQAATAILNKRSALPKSMTDYYNGKRSTFQREYEEIDQNMKERQARTGTEGIPVWPQTAELLAMLEPLVNATFNLSFQNKLAAGYAPYIPILEEIAAGLQPPPPAEPPAEGEPPADEEPFVPPIAGLQSGVAYFTAEAAKIRQGANALKGITVAGASTAEGLQQSLTAAQSRIRSAQGIHVMVDGAVEGLVSGLEKLKVIAVGMAQRYDYFNEDLVNGIVQIANDHVQNSAAQALEEVATFVDSIAKGLNDIIRGIQSGEEGAAEGAAAAVEAYIQAVTLRKANAEAAVAGLAAKVADLETKAKNYYFEFLRDKHRHCYHEDIVSDTMQPYYSMVDEYNRLQQPAELLAEFNSGLWSDLGPEILRIDSAQTATAAAKIEALARAAGYSTSIPQGGDVLPSVPQGRFSGVCVEYAPDDGKLFVSTQAYSTQVASVSSAALRINREIKRRAKVEKTAQCAPTNLKCLKRVAKQAKLKKKLEKYKTTVKSRAKKFRKQVPARLNNAYKSLYGSFPVIPYR